MPSAADELRIAATNGHCAAPPVTGAMAVTSC